MALSGWNDDLEGTILDGCNLSASLRKNTLISESRQLMRQLLPKARLALGEDHEWSLEAAAELAYTLAYDPASHAELAEAEALMAGVVKISQRIFGPQHPKSQEFVRCHMVIRDGIVLEKP